MSEDNGWNEWRHHVLSELARLSENDEALGDKVDMLTSSMNEQFGALHVQLAKMQARSDVISSIWGFAAGILASLGIAIVKIKLLHS